MGEFNLNLSTRPFPAYRVANLALLLFFVVISGVTVWQVYSFRHYSSLAKNIRDKEKAAREEKGSLTNTLNDLGTRLDRGSTTRSPCPWDRRRWSSNCSTTSSSWGPKRAG